ncbi:MAG TPA: vitamin K epoxide reductase family protein [Dongiaceae bacterium]|nr:vitamin K epoxide reductase family protein [Dongiaceae bacterium]
MKGRLIRYLMLGCCLGGGILSTLSLRNHYSTDPTGYCDLNATFNCDFVNRSSFSEFRGVPVALIGLLGYVLLFALSMPAGKWVARFRFAASVIGVGFALYLAYIEAYVLAVWCLLCIGSLMMISAITVLSGMAAWRIAGTETAANARD